MNQRQRIGRPAPRHLPARLMAGSVVLAGLLALSLLAGCDQAKQVVDQAAGAARQAADSATADAATAAVGTATTAALAKADITLVAPPDCTSDLDVDGAAVTAQGTVTCVARTTEREAVRAVFEGSLSASGCTGSLQIEVQGREPISIPKVAACRIAQLVGGAGEGSES